MSLWAACYIVAIGWGLYIIYSAICVVAFIFVRYAMVETRHKTLEEMSRLFGIEEKLVTRSGLTAEEKEGVIREQIEEVNA